MDSLSNPCCSLLDAVVQAGFSVLGYNRAGYGASSGVPTAVLDAECAEALLQYAHSLGFKPEVFLLT